MKYRIVILLLVCLSCQAIAQTKVRKLPTSINHPSLNLYAPYMSADANAMVFLSDNAEDQMLAPFYTFREGGDWRSPQMLPKSLHSRVNFLRGYALSADGKKIFVTTIRAPGVGGYDIQISDWKGSVWSEPVNPGMPINTRGHEGCPSVTPDGNVMYFMRCETMDQEKADRCKLYRVSKKSNGQWDEPAELPANINAGNSQAPRIMADGETLIFSSNKHIPNKGGMDLYVSRAAPNNTWTDPLPLDFVNTTSDDQYVTVSALGRYLIRDSPGPRKNELVEYLFPDHLRPKGLMKVNGLVTGPDGAAVPAYVSVLDARSQKQVYNGKVTADGTYMLYLKEGSVYELTIEPERDNLTFFSRLFDVSGEKIPQSEKVSAILKPAEKGDEIPLDLVRFKPFSAEIDLAVSANELRRLTRVLNANPSLAAEIQVMLSGYTEDTVAVDDLTEIVYDSVTTQVDDIDTLGQLFKRDTTMVKVLYHNDRTHKQAEAIVRYLTAQGINPSRLSVFGNAVPAVLPEERRLKVRAVLR